MLVGMVRAVFFDFYSVWAPDKLSYYLAQAELAGPEIAKELSDIVEGYYHGKFDIDYVASSFKVKLSDAAIAINEFKLQESDISSAITDFIRQLHEHFVKVGILANLGAQEYELLKNFDQHNQVFEVIASPLSLQLEAPLFSQQVFAQALQVIGEPPQSCLLVSGNRSYLDFAANLGMQVLQYEGLPSLQNSLAQLVTNVA